MLTKKASSSSSSSSSISIFGTQTPSFDTVTVDVQLNGIDASWSPISMADQLSSIAAKRYLKPFKFRDLIKRPKSANDSASESNSTLVSVSSAIGAHDPIPGNNAGSVEPTASSKCIGSILVSSDSTSPGSNATLNQGMYYPASGFLSLSGLSPPSRSYHTLPVSKTLNKRSRSARFRCGPR